jgi:hypothetical protein
VPAGWVTADKVYGTSPALRGWFRWVTLSMLAYMFLVVAAVTEHAATHHRWGSPVDLQRDPVPARRTHCGSRPPAALVVVATPPASRHRHGLLACRSVRAPAAT